ncbi:hypothetical protein [Methylobacterium planeticum]|uniref:Uncharacterized protein n=1 Tax=Methylobacterium planeticum TaxID=2615211 RepID=A0A6N6MFL4_9HYPH|nr:hypothetical protein [Methylobacterium planeticum]KAB1068182.1 hypothetical protein F6X51_27110 [Methylobacterium planeticum]
MPDITLQHVRIDTRSPDSEGLLAFVDGKLVAVLMRLSDELHGAAGFSGQWCVEMGFGSCTVGFVPVLLDDVEAVRRWVAERNNDGPHAAAEARSPDRPFMLKCWALAALLFT